MPNVSRHPKRWIRYPASGAITAPPAPYPITIIPVTSPRRSGNHFIPTERGHV